MLVPISQINPSKEALEGHINDLELSVKEGSDVIRIAVALQFMNQICEGAKKRIAPLLVTELQKAKERKDYFGYKIEVGECGTKYDYSNCGDVILYNLNDELEKIQSKIKDRQEMIKTLKEPLMIADPETGELFKVCPAIKTSTTAPKFSLK